MFLSFVTVAMKLYGIRPERWEETKWISELPPSRKPFISNKLYMLVRSLLNAARCHKVVQEMEKLELSWEYKLYY